MAGFIVLVVIVAVAVAVNISIKRKKEEKTEHALRHLEMCDNAFWAEKVAEALVENGYTINKLTPTVEWRYVACGRIEVFENGEKIGKIMYDQMADFVEVGPLDNAIFHKERGAAHFLHPHRNVLLIQTTPTFDEQPKWIAIGISALKGS